MKSIFMALTIFASFANAQISSVPKQLRDSKDYSVRSPDNANDDIVVKKTAPKWGPHSTLSELTTYCEKEKAEQAQYEVCSKAVMAYARAAINEIPESAQSIAQNLISKHGSNPKEAAYQFILHDAHTVLGRIFLKNGNVKGAMDELQKSIQVPPTPPLQTVGPRMTLASELLAQGEKKAVMGYLSKAEKVWTTESGKAQLATWKKEIQSGKTPEMKN